MIKKHIALFIVYHACYTPHMSQKVHAELFAAIDQVYPGLFIDKEEYASYVHQARYEQKSNHYDFSVALQKELGRILEKQAVELPELPDFGETSVSDDKGVLDKKMLSTDGITDTVKKELQQFDALRRKISTSLSTFLSTDKKKVGSTFVSSHASKHSVASHVHNNTDVVKGITKDDIKSTLKDTNQDNDRKEHTSTLKQAELSNATLPEASFGEVEQVLPPEQKEPLWKALLKDEKPSIMHHDKGVRTLSEQVQSLKVTHDHEHKKEFYTLLQKERELIARERLLQTQQTVLHKHIRQVGDAHVQHLIAYLQKEYDKYKHFQHHLKQMHQDMLHKNEMMKKKMHVVDQQEKVFLERITLLQKDIDELLAKKHGIEESIQDALNHKKRIDHDVVVQKETLQRMLEDQEEWNAQKQTILVALEKKSEELKHKEQEVEEKHQAMLQFSEQIEDQKKRIDVLYEEKMEHVQKTLKRRQEQLDSDYAQKKEWLHKLEQELAYKEQQLHTDHKDVIREHEQNQRKAHELLEQEQEIRSLKVQLSERLRDVEQEHTKLQQERKMLEISAQEVAYHVDEVVRDEEHKISIQKSQLEQDMMHKHSQITRQREEELAKTQDRLRRFERELLAQKDHLKQEHHQLKQQQYMLEADRKAVAHQMHELARLEASLERSLHNSTSLHTSPFLRDSAHHSSAVHSATHTRHHTNSGVPTYNTHGMHNTSSPLSMDKAVASHLVEDTHHVHAHSAHVQGTEKQDNASSTLDDIKVLLDNAEQQSLFEKKVSYKRIKQLFEMLHVQDKKQVVARVHRLYHSIIEQESKKKEQISEVRR